jgi:archaellum biogenesis ATPase FlaH
MDCLDQITLVKGFDNTLTLINDIRNICRENNSILLLSVNPEIFDKEQLSFFEKEFLEVK